MHFKTDVEAKLDPPQHEYMNAVFSKLSSFVSSVDPFAQAQKILNQRISEGAAACSLSWNQLLYPANLDMLPAFIFENLHAKPPCCSDVAAFVFDKLRTHAPHLLNQALPPGTFAAFLHRSAPCHMPHLRACVAADCDSHCALNRRFSRPQHMRSADIALHCLLCNLLRPVALRPQQGPSLALPSHCNSGRPMPLFTDSGAT